MYNFFFFLNIVSTYGIRFWWLCSLLLEQETNQFLDLKMYYLKIVNMVV